MRAKNRLFYQQLVPLWVLLLASFVTIGVLTANSISTFYYRQTKSSLFEHLYTFGKGITPILDKGEHHQMERFCRRQTPHPVVRLTVILPDGKVICDSRADHKDLENHGDRPEIMMALANKKGVALRHSETLDAELFYAALPLHDPQGRVRAVVRIALPNQYLRSTLHSFYIKFFLLGTIVFLSALLFSFLILRKLNRTTNALIHGAGKYAKGDLDHTIDIGEHSYLSPLAKTMTDMAQELALRIRLIKDQERDLETLLSSMSEAMVAVDNSGRIFRYNEAFLELFSIEKRPQTTGPERPLLYERVFLPDLHDLVKAVLNGEPTQAQEMDYLQGNTKQHLYVNANRLYGDSGEPSGAIVVLTNITRTIQLERIRKDFVANVSHELKTPTTVIKGYAETLLMGVKDPQKATRFTQKLLTQAERLEQILEDLLSLSRLEAGELGDLECAPQNLHSLTRQALVHIDEKASARGVELLNQVPREISVTVNAPLVIQAVINLVDNAVKYGNPNSQVILAAEVKGRWVSLSVTDQGEGIEPMHLNRLFERFYRVDKGRSKAMGGTGLGLAIVKHVVTIHGGQSTVDSTPSVGTTFTITLPLSQNQ